MKPRTFAIGDIHGCEKTFSKLIWDKLGLTKADTIYCIGDYVDRGPNSKGVVDLILELRASGYQIHTLRGNHEQLMMDSREDPGAEDAWLQNGGMETLNSFGAEAYVDFEQKYKDFFDATQFYIEAGKFIYVHAGLDFEKEDPFENTEAMLWIRDFPIDPEKLGDRMIIHGHSAKPAVYILTQAGQYVINIDGGCVYRHREGYGYLFALEVNTMEFISVRNCE